MLIEILAGGVVDSSGNPLDSGIVYIYEIGTTTPVTTYQDSDLTIPHQFPITLSAAGKAEVYTNDNVRILIEDQDGNTIDDFDFSGKSSAELEEFGTDIIPNIDSTYNIGSQQKKWDEGWFNTLHGTIADGEIESVSSNNPDWISNVGFSYSGGTLTITDAQGATFSESNPGSITVPSVTGGQLVPLRITVGGSFNDDTHATSSLTNLGFGITEAADWAQDIPFFLYAVNRGNADIDGVNGSSAFFLARSPTLHTTPSSANDIGDTASIPVNDSQNVILILGDVTVANYVSLPCQLIGTLRMQWVTSSDDWTVQTPGNTDGFGLGMIRKQLSRSWTMPAGQNGASANTYLLPNGGTSPVFSANAYSYKIHLDGDITVEAIHSGDGGADGAGAVAARFVLPVTSKSSFNDLLVGTTQGVGGPASGNLIYLFVSVSTNVYATLRSSTSNGGANPDNMTGDITLAQFSAGARNINLKLRYKGF